MPNVASVLKSEMARIGRKQAREETGSLRSASVRLKKDVVILKRRLAALEAQNKLLSAAIGKVTKLQPLPVSDEDAKKARFTAKGMRSLRRKLGLTSVALAKLLGTTAQTVYLWEHKNGPLKLRGKTISAILQVRDLGKRDVKKMLEEMDPAPAAAEKAPVKKPVKKSTVKPKAKAKK